MLLGPRREDVEDPHRRILSNVIAAAFTALALVFPPQAVVVPGKSFAGLHLGASGAQVRATWGPRYGRCRACTQPTWFFTYKRFEPQGAGVSFRSGTAEAYFTIWGPPGWHTDRGLKIGDPAPRVTQLYGVLPRVECGTYVALVLRRGRTATQIYLYNEQVWGFGLSSVGAGAAACH
jgi:hypothetical protein